MTRRRLLLALVLPVLAVGCLAPWWEEVAYVEQHELKVHGYIEIQLIPRWFFIPKRDAFEVCSNCFYADRAGLPRTHPDLKDLRLLEDIFDLSADTHGACHERLLKLYQDSRTGHEIGGSSMVRVRAGSRGSWEGTGSCLCPSCYRDRQ